MTELAHKVRLIIIGAGKMGKLHTAVFSAIPGVEIVGVVSRSGTSAEALAKEFKIPFFGTDWKKIAEDTQANAAVVSVSHLLSEEIVSGVVQANLHVFAEKPLCLESSRAKDLSELARKHQVVNMVGVNRRFYPSVLHAVETLLFSGGVRGACMIAPDPVLPYRAMGTYDTEVYNQWFKMNTLHAVDTLRFVSGGEVTRVTAHNTKDNHGEWSMNAILEFDNGAVSTFTSINSYGGMGSWQLSIFGNGIEARLSPLEKGNLVYDTQSVMSLPTSKNGKFKPGFTEQAKHFVSCIQTNGMVRHPGSDFLDHSKTLALCEQLMKSI